MSLSDAAQSCFPLRTESMLLVWNGVWIPLGYKYDVSLIIDDAVDLIDALSTHTNGSRTIHWPSNTFAASWTIAWARSEVAIDATWRSVVGGTESLLGSSGPVTISADGFMAEWKQPLEIVYRAIRDAGYSEPQIPRLAALARTCARIPRYGELYTDDTPS